MREPITIGKYELQPRDIYVLANQVLGGFKARLSNPGSPWRLRIHKFEDQPAYYILDGERHELDTSSFECTISGDSVTEQLIEVCGAIRYVEDGNGCVTEIVSWGILDYYGREYDNVMMYAFEDNARLLRIAPGRLGMFDNVHCISSSFSGGPTLHIPDRFFEGCIGIGRLSPAGRKLPPPLRWHDGTVGNYLCCNINAPGEDIDLTDFFYLCSHHTIGPLTGTFMNLKARNIVADYAIRLKYQEAPLGDDMFKGMECNTFKAYGLMMFTSIPGLGRCWFANTKGKFNLTGTFAHYDGVTLGEDMFMDSDITVVLDQFLYFSTIQNISGSTFRGLTNITSLTRMFQSTGKLKTLPLLFDPNPKVTSISGMFEGSGIVSIPEDFFDNFPNVTNCVGTFKNCGSLTDAPKLWLKFPQATGTGCYAGCVSLPWSREIPEGWR